VILPDEKDAIGLAVGLVNTWDVLHEPPERLDDVERLRLILRWFELPDAADRAAEADLASVRRVRDRLRRAFEASTEADAVQELNALARSGRAVPQLERANGGWTFRYGAGGALAADLAARTSVALLGVIERDGWDRFGVCAAAPCCCVYVDRSRNRSRRYCCELCADRATQAAARRRRKLRAS
jgi:predicted RNA-binding Zn ribbon-like protein